MASPITIRGAVLTASDGALDDAFGTVIAVSNDGAVMAIGSPSRDTAGSNRGAVYIYDRSGSTWTERAAIIIASDQADGDGFGEAVALSSDGAILAVGAKNRASGGTARGAVYLYDWGGSSWTERAAILTAADQADNDRFGVSAALSSDGTVLVVGADGWEGGTGANRGGVYTYDWSGGAWVQRGSVLEGYDNGAAFAYAIGLSGDKNVLIVGVNSDPNATGGLYPGAAYIYDVSGSTWVLRGSLLQPSDPQDFELFGIGVSINSDGSRIAVSSVSYDDGSGNYGSVRIYDYVGMAWAQNGDTINSAGLGAADFGISVALSGDGLVVVIGDDRYIATVRRGGVFTYDMNVSAPAINRTMTYDYVPGPVPRDPIQLQQFLEIELNKIKSAYDHLAAGHLDKLHVAPAKPRDGDIRYADGTNWNPGSGQGLYYYKDTAWVLIV